MTQPIRAFSLWQPWASFMAWGYKPDETRGYPTKVRGQVAIHAAKVLDDAGADWDLTAFVFAASDLRQACPGGAYVAVGDLWDCVPTESIEHEVSEVDRLAGNFAVGRSAWRFRTIRPLAEPIPAKGKQGFWWWTPPDDLEARLLPPVDHAEIVRKWEART